VKRDDTEKPAPKTPEKKKIPVNDSDFKLADEGKDQKYE